MSTLRTRFGIPGIIATVALVFAMTGGAFAAKYLITSTKQISPSVLKKLKGATGPAGAAGAQGPAGSAGAKGDAGAAGQNGAKGEQGPKGEKGAQGEKGSQGEKGAQGEKGSPWTAGGTLPSGATETGAWAFGEAPAGAVAIPISFAVPLASPLSGSGCQAKTNPCQVHFINKAGMEVVFDFINEAPETRASTECLGSAAAPTAKPGNLCVYEGSLSGTNIMASNTIYDPKQDDELSFSLSGAGTTGARMLGFLGAKASGWGTWAVTAP